MLSKLNLMTCRNLITNSKQIILFNHSNIQTIRYVPASCYHVITKNPLNFPKNGLQSRFMLNPLAVRGLSGTSAITSATTTNEAIAENISTTVANTIQNAPDVASAVTAAATSDPVTTFYGLSSIFPKGLVQNYLEFLHFSFDLPWWVAIALATISIRVLVLPVYIIAQRNGARLHNNLPEMQALQKKLSLAKEAGDTFGSRRYSHELSVFLQEKKCNPFKNFIMPLCQAPIFISFFFAIREMARLPVESFKTGGALWFTDLTAADPTFILPALMSATLAVTIESNLHRIDTSKIEGKISKYTMRVIPIFMFPFTMNFEAAMVCYWTTTNLITMCLTWIFKINAVRSFFNIDPLINHGAVAAEKQKEEASKKPVKDSFANIRKNAKRSYEQSKKL